MNKAELDKLKENQIGKKNLLVKILSNRILFALHLFAYVAVSGLLVLIWALTGFGYFWPYFEMFGWGFGIGLHTITYLMYNNKIKFLSEISRQSTFGILFIFHAWFYITVNIFLILIDLTNIRELFFYWPLSMWGIGFGFHALGFFFWEQSFNREMNKIKLKFPEYDNKKLTVKTKSKIANFWLLLAHIVYFIVVNIIIYINQMIYNWKSSNFTLLEGTLSWGTVLTLHIFGFYLFFYTTFKPELKGILIHLLSFIGVNAWFIYFDFRETTRVIWFYNPLILWAIALAIHFYIYYNWDTLKTDALKTIERKYGQGLDKYDIEKKALRLSFWKWSFISHIFVWAGGIILIGIQMAIYGIKISNLIHPAMGWLIGVAFHGGIFFIVQKPISGIFPITAILHASVYITTCVYLIILNVIYSPLVPWSAIAIVGWGIGFGLHLILAYFIKK
jgi:hypothetical protein